MNSSTEKKMWIPRTLEHSRLSEVRVIYSLCHPDLPPRAPSWYFVHPTITVENDAGNLVGFTSFTVTQIPGHGDTMYGKDVCVHPEWRGQGIAESLHAARLTIAQSVGLSIFMGTCKNTNKAMIRILEKSGMHQCLHIGEDILFVGTIREI